MDYQVFLTYIVLALIIAITIHIIFRAFYSCYYKNTNNEGFCDINKQNNLQNQDQCTVYNMNLSNDINDDTTRSTMSSISTSNIDNIPNNLMSDESKHEYDQHDHEYDHQFDNNNDQFDNDYIVGISNKTPKLIGCTSCDVNNTFIKENLMDNSINCPTQEKHYSNEQLKDYRNNFFGFRSHVWQESAGVDPVDKINERILNGDGDISKSRCGEKISDVYNSLTKDSVHEKHCVMSQNLDNISMIPQYKMQGSLGDFYTRDNWMYNYDHVMNGALFYNGVSGMDPLMNDQMAIN